MAARDVHRAKVFRRCEPTTGIEPYHRLVGLLMGHGPYRSARRVFRIADDGSSHKGEKSVRRMAQWHRNNIQVHLPVHPSWLNQIAVYVSIVSRKVLTPDDLADVEAGAQKLLAFQTHYETLARPFEWKFTRTTSAVCNGESRLSAISGQLSACRGVHEGPSQQLSDWACSADC